MSNLFGDLRIGLRSLLNNQAGLSLVNQNIANANTPGYTRKRMVPAGSTAVSEGVDLQRIESVRDDFLDRRLLGELQNKGSFEGQKFTLEQLEGLFFSSGQQTLGDQMSRFYNSFTELAANPSSLALRQTALAEAQKLSQDFRDTSQRISTLRADNRSQLGNSVQRINFLLDEIANVNIKLEPLLTQGQDGGTLQDEQQRLLTELAGEVGFSSYESESGVLNITTTSGTLLLSGSKVFKLSTNEQPDSVSVMQLGRDITQEIRGGKLSGFLELENNSLPGHISSLENLAKHLADQVNTEHRNGVGLDGTTNQDLFSYTTGNAAGSLSVAFTDPRMVAAGAAGAGPGDGSIAQNIADLRDKPLSALDNRTSVDYFSGIVSEVGLQSRSVRDSLAGQEKIVAQLQNQRDSVSGVSLDEEAVQLIQFQRSYQASARFIRVVDQLLQETMNLVG